MATTWKTHTNQSICSVFARYGFLINFHLSTNDEIRTKLCSHKCQYVEEEEEEVEAEKMKVELRR